MDRQSIIKPWDLECILCDETAEPQALPLSLLEEVTDCFSDEQQIGSGGFAVVYKGKLDTRTVAVKRISDAYMDEKVFHREIECLMMVKHRNIIRFLGYCANTKGSMELYDGNFVMADAHQRLLCFEYLPKGSLDKYITDTSRGLQWRDRYQIITGICQGLYYLHQKKIVHLDLKPANILLDDNLVPKITDFGISRSFHEIQSRSITTIAGTFGYLAPESFNNTKVTYRHSYRLDIYSLGVVIIEILTGEKGYHDVDNVVESWSNMLEKSQRDIQLKQVRVCAEIGIECIDSNPAKRPDTQHIINILNESIETGVITSHQPEDTLNELHQDRPNTLGETGSEENVTAVEAGVLPFSKEKDNHLYINQVTKDVQAEGSQRDSRDIRFNFEFKDQNPSFKGLVRSDVSENFEQARTQISQEPPAECGPEDPPDLASGLDKGNMPDPYLRTVLEEPSSFFEATEDDRLPAIDGLRIIGKAFPGREIQASGYSINGATRCKFEWVRHLEDGSVNCIEGATHPKYLVTANDVDSLLSVRIQPLDDRQRKGEIVKVYANERRKITCNPEMMGLIKKILSIGHVCFDVMLLPVRFMDTWEPAVLEIRRGGYSIECNGQRGVSITERFSHATDINIPYGRPIEFSIHFYHLKTTESSPSRDSIVLILRLFIMKALKKPSTSFSEAVGDDPLPAIDGLRITGEAFPGREIQVSGFSINGTTTCNFEWVRHLEDGSVHFIQGAREPTYLVTADDVDSLLAIEAQPLDERKRKGKFVKVFANERRKITCDPEMEELIKKIISIGPVSFEVLLPVIDMWEPAVLAIKREGYSIKCNGQRGVVISEEFQQATTISIPYGCPTEFSIQSADGTEYNLKPAESSPSRDSIVLILRLFRTMAVEKIASYCFFADRTLRS